MRLLGSLLVILMGLPASAQISDAERFELARKRLEERQRAAAEAATRASTQPASKPVAVPPTAATAGPVFDQAIAQVVRELTAINREKPPASLTTLQQTRWEESQAGRREEVEQKLVGKPFDAILTIVDVRAGSGTEIEVYATVPLEIPEHIANARRDKLAGIAAQFDARLAELNASMRSATQSRRKLLAEQADLLRADRDRSMAEERTRQAAVQQETEIRVSGIPPAELSGVGRGSKIRKKIVVRRIVLVESLNMAREGTADEQPASVIIDAELDTGMPPSTRPTSIATPVAVQTIQSLPNLEEEIAAMAAASSIVVDAVPPPGLTTVQVMKWREDQQAKRDAQKNVLVGKFFNALITVDDVVPVVGTSPLTHQEATAIRSVTDAKTAVVATIALKPPESLVAQYRQEMTDTVTAFDRRLQEFVEQEKLAKDEATRQSIREDAKPHELAKATAVAALKQRFEAMSPKARLVLVAADDRYSAKGKGEQITTPVEVILAEPVEQKTTRRPQGSTNETFRAVVLASAPKKALPTASRVVYLLDATGSMINKIGSSKVSLLKAAAALPPTTSFNVVTTTDGGKTASLHSSLVAASPQNVAAATPFVERVTPTGTDGEFAGALAAISKLRPEEVWFYTDAEFNEAQRARTLLVTAARRDGYRLNIVVSGETFGDSREHAVLLAESTGGICLDEKGRQIRSKSTPTGGRSNLFQER